MLCGTAVFMTAMVCAAGILSACATLFLSGPSLPSVANNPASTWTLPGRTEVDCAMKCASMDFTSCAVVAFSADWQLCWLASDPNLSNLASGSSVYQRQLQPFTAIIHKRIESRKFRVIQQRRSGSLSFARNWAEYQVGFGDEINFWIGLEAIHELTNSTPKLLRVEALSWSNVLYVCEYSGFIVASADKNYRMSYSSYLATSSNTTCDSLSVHNGRMFSTLDRDNDIRASESCSLIRGRGGWWFGSCLWCNPNGLYFDSAVDGASNMIWSCSDSWKSLQAIQLMLHVDEV